MDTGPASLGFDPTLEFEHRISEVGDRGLHLGYAATRVDDARLASLTVLACVTLGRRCVDQLGFVLESFHLRTPLLLYGTSSGRGAKMRPAGKRQASVSVPSTLFCHALVMSQLAPC